MDPATYRMELQAAQGAEHRIHCVWRIGPGNGRRLDARLDVAAAVAADDLSFLHPPTACSCQVIRSEMLTGLLAASRHAEGCWIIELVSLGASNGGSRDVSETPAIAFAVAASMVLRHATGAIDLGAGTHTGYGWVVANFARAT